MYEINTKDLMQIHCFDLVLGVPLIDFSNTYIIKNYQKKFCGGIECVKVESEFQN